MCVCVGGSVGCREAYFRRLRAAYSSVGEREDLEGQFLGCGEGAGMCRVMQKHAGFNFLFVFGSSDLYQHI